MEKHVLFSLNSDGSIQQWSIWVEGSTIIKEYGRVGGAIQKTTDTIEKGKNTGKINSTTPEEQARNEAQAQYEKKLKSGYVKTQEEARRGGVDKQFVVGGVSPMLAHKYRDHESKIVYPAFSQFKLDGTRTIAIVNNGTCTLWSRTQKPITSVPHIIKVLEETFPKQNITLDGELYNHAYKNSFEEIVSFVRCKEPKPGHEIIEYHIYDVVENIDFAERISKLNNIKFASDKIVKVKTRLVNNAEELMNYFIEDLENGYEGSMVRNYKGVYEYRRSYNLLKIKSFDDAEFKIVALEKGRGRMSSCAIFLCETKNGDRFSCKMKGSLDILKDLLINPQKAVGKFLTVQYQGLTNGSLPRFPIGLRIRKDV
jgi:ATP-dependent DNA ligase